MGTFSRYKNKFLEMLKGKWGKAIFSSINADESSKGGDGVGVSGSINGHDYVDLGLSVKWATCNVGARNPYAPGKYYSWSDKETTSVHAIGEPWFLDPADTQQHERIDIASVRWGRPWRMPSVGEFHELIKECEWESVLDSSPDSTIGSEKLRGYKITSKKNGRSIFLPAGHKENILDETCCEGYYWSSNSWVDEKLVREHHAYILKTYYARALVLDRDNHSEIRDMELFFKCSIRPVWDEQEKTS